MKDRVGSARPLALVASLSLGLVLLLATACSEGASMSVPSNRYALVIGVQDYPGAGNDLDYPDDDADALASLLENTGWTVRTRLISSSDSGTATDGSPTYAGIEAAIASLSDDPGATILVYYSGHGSTDEDYSTAYMIPYDGIASGGAYEESRWISAATMTGWLAAVPAKHRILILDSCYSGGFATSEASVDTTPANYGYASYEDGVSEKGLVSAALSRFSRLVSANLSGYGGDEVTALAAAGAAEFSYDDDEHARGAFTYYLMRAADSGDADSDGFVTVDEAYLYARAQLEANWNEAYSKDTRSWEWQYAGEGCVPDFLPHVSGGTGELVLYAGD